LIYLFLILLLVVAGEYFYFTQKLDSQRKQILVLSRHNDNLKSKVNKQSSSLGSVNIKYKDPAYKSAYTADNSILLLSPLEDSPVVYKFSKSTKVSLIDSAEILNSTWCEVSFIPMSGNRIKGWIKESEIKMMVEEASV
jgi:hypothetical protein